MRVARSSFHIFQRADNALSIPLSGREKGIRAAAAAILLRREIGARCDATVTYYSRATFHYTSFHSTPRAYYWHVFPLALSRVPISRIGKFFFLFPPAVIRHATHVEPRSSIVASTFYINVSCEETESGKCDRGNIWTFPACLVWLSQRWAVEIKRNFDIFRFHVSRNCSAVMKSIVTIRNIIITVNCSSYLSKL